MVPSLVSEAIVSAPVDTVLTYISCAPLAEPRFVAFESNATASPSAEIELAEEAEPLPTTPTLVCEANANSSVASFFT